MKEYCPICHQFEGSQYPVCPERLRPVRTMKRPDCKREVALIDISTACACLGVDPRTLYRWRKAGRISFVLDSGGRVLVYWSSLFQPPWREPERS
jgi:hypothetical protein